jgi:hypothetical protein
MQEVWKPVVGYEGEYEVSNFGSVASLPGAKGRNRGRKRLLLKPSQNTHKHLRVNFCLAGKRKSLYVHRLVLMAFVGPPSGDTQGAHLDGNPLNNRLENLVWATAKENSSHRIFHGTNSDRGEKCNLSRLQDVDIPKILNLRSQGFLIREIAENFKVKPGTIQAVLSGRSWSHISLL